MSILLRRVSAACTLLALVLCVPQGSLMLCAAEGGHVAIEGACSTNDATTHADHAPEASDADCVCHGDCGPCHDSQLGAELSLGRGRHEAAVGADALAPFALLPTPMVAPATPAPRVIVTCAMMAPRPPARVAAGVQLRI